ncbi:hypothetical protein KHA80_14295 [Anaerobacillus sp. HL2]|nr:hypothetical protein KHA80_14295 [Anaerobacillus sp. HL2]
MKTGHIWKAREGADVVKHYKVPCPHCGEHNSYCSNKLNGRKRMA